jgi:hypothetical protein
VLAPGGNVESGPAELSGHQPLILGNVQAWGTLRRNVSQVHLYPRHVTAAWVMTRMCQPSGYLPAPGGPIAE